MFGRPVNKLEDHRKVKSHDKNYESESKAPRAQSYGSDSEGSDTEKDVLKGNVLGQKNSHTHAYFPPMYQGPLTQNIKKKKSTLDKQIDEEINKFSVLKEGISHETMRKIRVSLIIYYYFIFI